MELPPTPNIAERYSASCASCPFPHPLPAGDPSPCTDIRFACPTRLSYPSHHDLRYQVQQHGDAPSAVTRKGYTSFLVKSPLKHMLPHAASCVTGAAAPAGASTGVGPAAAAAAAAAAVAAAGVQGLSGQAPTASTATTNSSGAECSMPLFCGLGSFHMQYRLDGESWGMKKGMGNCMTHTFAVSSSDPSLRVLMAHWGWARSRAHLSFFCILATPPFLCNPIALNPAALRSLTHQLSLPWPPPQASLWRWGWLTSCRAACPQSTCSGTQPARTSPQAS